MVTPSALENGIKNRIFHTSAKLQKVAQQQRGRVSCVLQCLDLKALACQKRRVTHEDEPTPCTPMINLHGILLSTLLHVFNKKLKRYVSCEFNRSADRSIVNFANCVNRSRVFHYLPSNRLLAGDSPGCTRVDETIILLYHFVR